MRVSEKGHKKIRRKADFAVLALTSFHFAAFNAPCANIFFGNGAVRMFNAYFLQVCFILPGRFAIGVAYRVSGKFAFAAYTAYSAHIYILRRELLLCQQQILYHIGNKKASFFNKI